MRTAIFSVSMNYRKNLICVEAKDDEFKSFNYEEHNITYAIAKQFQLTRDLSKQGVTALFEYQN